MALKQSIGEINRESEAFQAEPNYDDEDNGTTVAVQENPSPRLQVTIRDIYKSIGALNARSLGRVLSVSSSAPNPDAPEDGSGSAFPGEVRRVNSGAQLSQVRKDAILTPAAAAAAAAATPSGHDHAAADDADDDGSNRNVYKEY